ncbi:MULTISPECIES: phosphoribosyl-ATP diphosphatase [Chromobacterium]|jgi:phosphoribosyl-ATP pyrophosphohydrolase|uniref:Phosphoribosyl-ATP pyrophosphatase n=4 Tax=Chromobacterium TaxID=535 RepID=A0A1W0D8L6_9NEIS|nr:MULTISPECIES: phosphoribosyl-ATP diphosphatase [Chromobacterium]AXT48492.1 phosphoribosyl-ATP diphosphatase [Chromobacterium rhizoryzae]KMN38028.1 phosphoribosyl-ATP pyrophosphatase [Chromobacterium sp. LK1]KMN82868.1 phosphoribosyl-ATP pyrophosphatase [Chromobacterium sp. LK11]MBK0412869.1 phosphoribosyl-ATP diphosphatase [Chromobacterium haemolyticum]MBN3002226.1 phosphoribosyl-ATP diphosphatase [Chromobacterium alkanivorans]
MSQDVLKTIADTLEARREASSQSSYVASLFHKGEDAILKKVAEEAAETLMASKDKDKLHLVREVADLWFHSMVLLTYHGLRPEDVLMELKRREGISGLDEKASRAPTP